MPLAADAMNPLRGEGGGHHPWWSRVLYALYGLAACAAAWYAYTQDQTSAALIGAGIAGVLIWKATQKVR